MTAWRPVLAQGPVADQLLRHDAGLMERRERQSLECVSACPCRDSSFADAPTALRQGAQEMSVRPSCGYIGSRHS